MKTKEEIVDEMLIEAIKQNDLARAEKLFDLEGTPRGRVSLLMEFIHDKTNHTNIEPFLRLFIEKIDKIRFNGYSSGYGSKDYLISSCVDIAIEQNYVDLLENIAKLSSIDPNYIQKVIGLNSEEMFIALIKGGCRPNTGYNEYTNLIRNSDYRWLKLLIQHSDKINDDFIQHFSFSKEVIELFLDAGANPNIDNRYNPLFSNDYDKVKLLLDRGANPNIHNNHNYNRTPLHSSKFEISEILIQKGADVNTKDGYGRTPLHHACGGDFKKTQLLVDTLADVNAKDNDGWTPLHFACNNSINPEEIKFLLDNGADPKISNNDGQTPLHLASQSRYGGENLFASVKLLVDAGADIMAKDNKNQTLLHVVYEATLLDFLIKKGADVNAVDSNFRTPLHTASISGCGKKVKLLIKAGADVNAVDLNGDIPLHLAVKEDNLAVARILVDNDSDVEHINYEGRKPSNYTSWRRTSHKIRDYIQSYVSNKDPKVMERLRAERIKKAMEEQKIKIETEEEKMAKALEMEAEILEMEAKIREEIENFILAS